MSTRKNKYRSLSSFDDPALRKLKIGLPLISGGGANPPSAYALARRGLESNVIGYSMFEPEKIIDAVAAGEIDVAVVWGPFGGYFAKRQTIPLAVTPVSAGDNDSALRFTYDMSMGVRRGDTAFKDQLERVLDRRHKEIRKSSAGVWCSSHLRERAAVLCLRNQFNEYERRSREMTIKMRMAALACAALSLGITAKRAASLHQLKKDGACSSPTTVTVATGCAGRAGHLLALPT